MMIESTTTGRRARAGLPELRTVLRVDVATCLAMGVLLVAAAAPLSAALALPERLLFWAGLLLFPCAALMAGAAAMQPPAPWLVWAVILGNTAWVLASIGVLLLLAPTGSASLSCWRRQPLWGCWPCWSIAPWQPRRRRVDQNFSNGPR